MTGVLYVVVDVGCHECGVDSEEIGIYRTRPEADAAATETDKATGRWRDGGTTRAQVFTYEAPAWLVRTQVDEAGPGAG